MTFIKYLASLSLAKTILWCYLIWYLTTVYFQFEPSPRLWLNSIGISALIGFALLLSVNSTSPWKNNKWQTFRLFLIPFCVSSFSSLIKDNGFLLILPPGRHELTITVAICIAFICSVLLLKFTKANKKHKV